VAQGKQVMKQYDFDLAIADGKKWAEVPKEIIETANPLWDD